MGIVSEAKFHIFKEKIYSLQLPLSDNDLLNSNFLLQKNEKKHLEVYYTPFDYINEHACLVIAGITPGLHQMKKAYTAVLEVKDQQLSDEEILHEVKKSASFDGTMRNNLVTFLDNLRLHQYLGIESTGELFSSASHLVYNTSILPYAVFYKRKNFNGAQPTILKTDMLLNYVKDYFVKDIAKINDPLIIPLGVNVTKVLEALKLDHYILKGFPHPSGGNGHRHRQFRENKEDMIKQIENYFSK